MDPHQGVINTPPPTARTNPHFAISHDQALQYMRSASHAVSRAVGFIYESQPYVTIYELVEILMTFVPTFFFAPAVTVVRSPVVPSEEADAFLAPIHPTEQASHKEHSRILRAARAHRNRRAPSQH